MKNKELEFRKKINKLKTCECCGSNNLELKPLGIPFTTNNSIDDTLPDEWKKELKKLPTFDEALLHASEVHILCNDCKVAVKLFDKTLIPVIQQPTLKTRYDDRIGKIIDYELKLRIFP